MFRPAFNTTKSKVPVVSKTELDYFGERFVTEFCPDAMREPMEIDIDKFVTKYLGMKQDYKYLSHCGCYLGMMVFNDTDKIPVYDPNSNSAIYISVEAGTVIIDNNLLEESQERRYRFTVGHEGAHSILHERYYGYDPNQLSFFSDLTPMVKCRMESKSTNRKPLHLWNDNDTMEWQANYLSSAILMPKKMVNYLVNELKDKSYANLVLEVANTFNTSYESALYRLKDLKNYTTVMRNTNKPFRVNVLCYVCLIYNSVIKLMT